MEADRWLGLELRHLLALDAVAREGSFGRAARSLGYTQSAVSQQIAALERIVGSRLIERPGGPRPVSLTEAGELLLRHSEAIAARLAAAQADLAALADGAAGVLRVGIYQGVGERLGPARGGRARRARPDLRRPAASGGAVRVLGAAPRPVRAPAPAELAARRPRRAADRARAVPARPDRLPLVSHPQARRGVAPRSAPFRLPFR